MVVTHNSLICIVMEKSIDDRNEKGYITTADLVAFFGEGDEEFSKVGE